MHRERIGLFGGTFNPIHLGHMKAAEIVLKRFLLDRVLFIPSYIPPHKGWEDMALPEHRLEMVKLAVVEHIEFIPCPIEIEAKGKSYSILTLNKIREIYPDADIFFILGIDAFLEINTWKDYAEVMDRCFFIVMSRPDFRLKDAKNVLEGRYQEKTKELEASEKISLQKHSDDKIFLLPIDALDIASSEIRDRIKVGLSIVGMVVESVGKYIEEHKLYC